MGTENIKWLKLLHKATRWFRSVINDPEAATMKKKYVDYSTDNTETRDFKDSAKYGD